MYFFDLLSPFCLAYMDFLLRPKLEVLFLAEKYGNNSGNVKSD